MAEGNNLTEKFLSEQYKEIESIEPERYESKELKTDLDIQIEKEGEIISEKYIKELGATELLLSNGSKVVLKLV